MVILDMFTEFITPILHENNVMITGINGKVISIWACVLKTALKFTNGTGCFA